MRAFLLLLAACAGKPAGETADTPAETGPTDIPADPAHPYANCVGSEADARGGGAPGTVVRTTWDAAERVTERGTVAEDGTLTERYTWVYEGDCLVEATDPRAVVARTTYVCANGDGKPTSGSAYDADGAPLWDLAFTWREDGRLDHEDLDFDRDGVPEAVETWVWSVYETGAVAEVFQAFDGETTLQERYTYDAADRLLRWEYGNAGDDTFTYAYAYVRDEDGRVTDWTYTNADSERLVVYTHTFDAWGRVGETAVTITDPDAITEFTTTTTYACE
ncbi:MAG: hypothetical protein ACK4YP_20045 [Myxococcota bacterium]